MIANGQLCCGTVKDMLLGGASAVPPDPCVDTPTGNLVTNGTFDDETGWTYYENGDPGNRGLFIGGGYIGADMLPPTVNAYFFPLALNPDNVNQLAYEILLNNNGGLVPIFIELWAGNKSVVSQISALDPNVYNFTINPSDWTVTPNSQASAYLGMPDPGEGIYFLAVSNGLLARLIFILLIVLLEDVELEELEALDAHISSFNSFFLSINF